MHFPKCIISYTVKGSVMQHNTAVWVARLKARAATGRSINRAIGGFVRLQQGVLYFQNITAVSRYTLKRNFIYALQ